MNMLEKVRASIRAALDERAAHQATLNGILTAVEAEDRTDLTDDETKRFDAARDAIKAADSRVAELRAREAELVELDEAQAAADDVRRSLPDATPAAEQRAGNAGTPARVEVRSNELTYRRGGEHQYFRDLARAYEPGGNRDYKAMERIQRHAQEMEVEQRANMTAGGAGTGGEFVPPLWLMDQYIPLARAGRVTADLCRRFPLPAGTDSINIPKVATGTATAEQSEGSGVQETDMTTTSVSAAVTTFAGQQVFSMQLLDQSPIAVDEIVFADLLTHHATIVDQYVLNKASIGILNVSSIVAVTYTDADPTVPELFPRLADTVQQIHTNRFLSPQAWVMHPRRWGWLLAALDSTDRPLIVPSAQGPSNAFAGFGDVRAEGSVGTILGLPVYTDANVPTNLGAGTNQDPIIAARFDDLYLYEGALRTRLLFETDANTLEVRVQLWNYGAFMGNRYPKSIGAVTGTGLVTPTFT